MKPHQDVALVLESLGAKSDFEQEAGEGAGALTFVPSPRECEELKAKPAVVSLCERLPSAERAKHAALGARPRPGPEATAARRLRQCR
jgi:hypothetical protein